MSSQIPKEEILTISELSNLIYRQINQQYPELIYVSGELFEMNKAQSGHVYITLKDKNSSINCTLWKSKVSVQNKIPDIGSEIIIKCKVNFYPPRSSISLDIYDIYEIGSGNFHKIFEDTKNKLIARGLLDNKVKKVFPRYPTGIAIITSLSGSVYKDILKIISRRFPVRNVGIFNCAVQGNKCADTIIKQLKLLEKLDDYEIIMIARGGGSLDDLIGYNNEKLANEIFNSKKPVVTAIGHETDTTICDLVSDFRAATPSEAAEFITPNIIDVKEEIENTKVYLKKDFKSKIDKFRNILIHVNQDIEINSPKNKLKEFSQKIYFHKKNYVNNITNIKTNYNANLKELFYILKNNNPYEKIKRTLELVENKRVILEQSKEKIMESERQELVFLKKTVESVNPENVLERGYSLTYDSSGNVITKSSSVKKDDIITSRLSKGLIKSKVLLKNDK